MTDENGGFATSSMPPGQYRLDVNGWGSTTIQLSLEPENRMGGKIPLWGLILTDNACVVTVISEGWLVAIEKSRFREMASGQNVSGYSRFKKVNVCSDF